MPLYEYFCLDCGVLTENLRSMSDTSTFPCPSCNSTHTRKKVSIANSIMGGVPDFRKQESRDLDRLIGQDSEKRWKKISETEKKKRSIRDEAGTTPLSRVPESEESRTYIPVSSEAMSKRREMAGRYTHAQKTGIKIVTPDKT